MKRNFARLSVSATPLAPAASVDFLASVCATAPRPDAATPGRIDSDSLRDENQTGSNPFKVNPSRSNQIKPQKIKKSAHAPRSISSQPLLPSRGNPDPSGVNQGKPDLNATPPRPHDLRAHDRKGGHPTRPGVLDFLTGPRIAGPLSPSVVPGGRASCQPPFQVPQLKRAGAPRSACQPPFQVPRLDRKSTRLNSSH